MSPTALQVQAGTLLAERAHMGEAGAPGHNGGPRLPTDLILLVERMRTQQKIYFSQGKPSMLKQQALKEARALEKEVDTFIALYKIEAAQWERLTSPNPPTVQGDLFLMEEGPTDEPANPDE